jgi:hypothetical protein
MGKMSALIGLAGALVGALIALLGQLSVTRAMRRGEWIGKLHSRCAEIYALEREGDLAAWEVLKGRDNGRMDRWDYAARRLAEAEILLATRDPELTRALVELTNAGVHLSTETRRLRQDPAYDPAGVKAARERHSAATVTFCEAARNALGVPGLISAGSLRTPDARAQADQNAWTWPLRPHGHPQP